jgi:serine/threonine-protein kinase RsbT
MVDEIHCKISSEDDLVTARARGRELALQLGFSKTDATLVATAISEIARNIVVHVGEGHIHMSAVLEDRRFGLVVIAADKGPGIRDLDTALELGYASRGGLGLGLPGARRLMDDFCIESNVDRGTTVTMVKWRVRDELEILRDARRRKARDTGGVA